MKKIKLKFLGFTSKIMEDSLRAIINKNYEIIDSENPDYVIYWVYDSKHLDYDCVRILYTSECYTPDFNDCDYAIGFDRLQFGDRYIRVPLYDLFQYKDSYRKLKNRRLFTLEDVKNKTGFCSFVVSNCFAKDTRLKLLEKLSEYKRVDSGGRFRNNIGGAVKDKFAFQQCYKFAIACENCSYDGYTTEKIMEAFSAGAIPIYYGDPHVVEDFNPDSFVNVHDYNSLDEVLERVKEIDNNDDLYLSILNQQVVNPNVNIGNIEEFFKNIFEQPLHKSKRRSCSQAALVYENERKRHRFFETYIYKYCKKIYNQIFRIKSGTLITYRRTK